MDLRDLRYFIAVYEAAGFSRASRALGTVQSNVSARIRNLEDSLGVELFRRRHQPGEQADDHHDDQQLEQREAARAAFP